MQTETQTETGTTKTRHPGVGVHATLLNTMSHETAVIHCVTRTDLAKALEDYTSEWKVLSVVKGRKLNIEEKRKVNFS